MSGTVKRCSRGDILFGEIEIFFKEIKSDTGFWPELGPIGQRCLVMIIRADFLADITAEDPAFRVFDFFFGHGRFLFDGLVADAFGRIQLIQFKYRLGGAGIQAQAALPQFHLSGLPSSSLSVVKTTPMKKYEPNPGLMTIVFLP